MCVFATRPIGVHGKQVHSWGDGNPEYEISLVLGLAAADKIGLDPLCAADRDKN